MSLLGFFQWLGTTPLSVHIRESTWTFPFIESVHVLGLCLFLGFSVILDLRLLGLVMRRVPVSEVHKRLLPWTWAGAVIMVISGIFTFFNDPARYYLNIFFRVKLVMLALAVLNAWLFEVGIYRRIHEWDLSDITPKQAKIAGYASLFLWACIVIAGRMIAYNWFEQQ